MESPQVRRAAPEDEPFLRDLYRETRAGEFAVLGWSAAQVAALCNQQFDAQSSGYRSSYPDAEHLVICDGPVPVGRMITARADGSLFLVDIALMPAFRNRGWGRLLVSALQEEARNEGIPLMLQVEKAGRALALYQRLGFVVEGEDGVRYTMKWISPATDL